jgi:hypothetical protein
MIISYWMGRNQREAVEMCGEFRDLYHFDRFREIEKSYGRFIYSHKILRAS